MQATNRLCNLNRTSALDRWMTSDESPVYVGSQQLGALSSISENWNARLILANALYFNMVNVLTDSEADQVIQTTFQNGDESGQLILAPTYQWVYPKLEADEVNSQIASRILAYLFSIRWTTALPYHNYEARDFSPLKERDKIIRLVQFDDGDYALMLGKDFNSVEATAPINAEISRFLLPGHADVDFMYFSSKEKALNTVRVIQKYISEKWGFDFSLADETKSETC